MLSSWLFSFFGVISVVLVTPPSWWFQLQMPLVVLEAWCHCTWYVFCLFHATKHVPWWISFAFLESLDAPVIFNDFRVVQKFLPVLSDSELTSNADCLDMLQSDLFVGLVLSSNHWSNEWLVNPETDLAGLPIILKVPILFVIGRKLSDQLRDDFVGRCCYANHSEYAVESCWIKGSSLAGYYWAPSWCCWLKQFACYLVANDVMLLSIGWWTRGGYRTALVRKT